MRDYHRSILFCIAMTVAWSLVAQCQEQSRIDPIEIVGRFRASAGWSHSVSMHLDIETLVSGSEEGRVNEGHVRYGILHRRDRDRTEWLGRSELLDDDGSVVDEKSQETVEVMNGEYFLSAARRLDRPSFHGNIKREFQEDQSAFLVRPSYGGFVDGAFPLANGKTHIADMLSEAPRLVKREVVDGISSLVIESNTDYGTVTAWIAPDKGYTPVKYVYSKTEDDLLRDKPLQETNIADWTIVVDSIKTTQIGDTFVPISGTYTHTTHYRDGLVKTTWMRCERTEVDLEPDFEALGAFKIDLPAGTEIRDQDFGIVWQLADGTLEPKIPQATLDSIRRSLDDLASGEETNQMGNASSADRESTSPVSAVSPESDMGRGALSLWLWGLVFVLTILLCGWGFLLFSRSRGMTRRSGSNA